MRTFSVLLALVSLVAIGVACERLLAARSGVTSERVMIGETPATVFQPETAGAPGNPPPNVLVAHGFAGSRTLMAPFAVALAKNGYTAITFDFVGHGEHPATMTGDVTRVDGPTHVMVDQMGEAAAYARERFGTDQLAVLGHSMASDIVVRFAKSMDSADATIAVSMFSPAVTATEPRNLLVIVGNLEVGLKREALRAVGLATAPAEAVAGKTYGTFGDGTARRAVFAGGSEHIAVLFDTESLTEAVRWLDDTYRVTREEPVAVAPRLPWIGLLVVGILALGYPLSRLLPVLSDPPTGGGVPWRRLWPVVVIPALAVPVGLRFLPTDILPIVVGDYLAIHFLAYGLVTAALMGWLGRSRPVGGGKALRAHAVTLAAVSAGVTAYSAGALGLAIELNITNYHPVPARFPLFAALLVGTLVYFIASEWAARGQNAGRAAPLVETCAFVLSLTIAVALDFERLFFLIIIVPVIVLFFVIYGLFSRWSYWRTGHPLPGAVATAVAFAWGITVTFPMLAG